MIATRRFDGLDDHSKVPFQHCEEQRLLVWEILVQSPHRDARAKRHPGGVQPGRPVAQQNLNACLENGIYRDRGAGLTRRFAPDERHGRNCFHMRIQKPKNASYIAEVVVDPPR
jgi:hypothetical protein